MPDDTLEALARALEQLATARRERRAAYDRIRVRHATRCDDAARAVQQALAALDPPPDVAAP
jgi:hypothetical protein